MGRTVSGVPFLILWFVTLVLALFAISLIFPSIFKMNGLEHFVSGSSKNIYKSSVETSVASETQLLISASPTALDGRVAVINNFLEKYDSPMAGNGRFFVAAADRYGIDWRLLPAIAFQESSLGKNIPNGTYNPFGWAVYTSASRGADFDDWSNAIFTVAAGMREHYINHGLATPEAIAVKYTANTSPRWVFAVRLAMDELSQGHVY